MGRAEKGHRIHHTGEYFPYTSYNSQLSKSSTLTAGARWIPILPGVYTRSVRGEVKVYPLPSAPTVSQSLTMYAATVVPSAQAGIASVRWVVSGLRGADEYEEEKEVASCAVSLNVPQCCSTFANSRSSGGEANQMRYEDEPAVSETMENVC